MATSTLTLLDLPNLTEEDHLRLSTRVSIHTPNDLLQYSRTKSQRLQLCLTLGIHLGRLWYWLSIADLCRVNDVLEKQGIHQGKKSNVSLMTVEHASMLMSMCSIQSLSDLVSLEKSGRKGKKLGFTVVKSSSPKKQAPPAWAEELAEKIKISDQSIHSASIYAWVTAATSLSVLLDQKPEVDAFETLEAYDAQEYLDVSSENGNQKKGSASNSIHDAAFRHFCCVLIYKETWVQRDANPEAAYQFLETQSERMKNHWKGNAYLRFTQYAESAYAVPRMCKTAAGSSMLLQIDPTKVTNAEYYQELAALMGLMSCSIPSTPKSSQQEQEPLEISSTPVDNLQQSQQHSQLSTASSDVRVVEPEVVMTDHPPADIAAAREKDTAKADDVDAADDDDVVVENSKERKERELIVNALQKLPVAVLSELKQRLGLASQKSLRSLRYTQALELFVFTVETYLRVFFESEFDSAAQEIVKSMLGQISQPFTQLQSRNVISIEAVKTKEAYILHEFFSFVTIVRDLADNLSSQETITTALTIGKSLCSYFPSECQQLNDVLKQQGGGDLDRGVVTEATVAACRAIPFRIPELSGAVSALVPLISGSSPSAAASVSVTPKPQPTKPRIVSIRDDDADTDDVQAEQRTKRSRSNPPPASLTESLGITGTKKVADAASEERNKENKHVNWDSHFDNTASDIQELDDGDDAQQQQPANTAAASSSKAPSSKPQVSVQSVLAWKTGNMGSTNTAPAQQKQKGTQAVASARTDGNDAAVPSAGTPTHEIVGRYVTTPESNHTNSSHHQNNANLTTPQNGSSSPASGGLSASELKPYVGRWHCQSKYHAKYSTPAKHGSSQCQWCVVCHMLEILFDGCTHDCSWKHYPTKKKISTHLSRFPDILQRAHKVLADEQKGIRPKCVEIPL